MGGTPECSLHDGCHVMQGLKELTVGLQFFIEVLKIWFLDVFPFQREQTKYSLSEWKSQAFFSVFAQPEPCIVAFFTVKCESEISWSPAGGKWGLRFFYSVCNAWDPLFYLCILLVKLAPAFPVRVPTFFISLNSDFLYWFYFCLQVLNWFLPFIPLSAWVFMRFCRGFFFISSDLQTYSYFEVLVCASAMLHFSRPTILGLLDFSKDILPWLWLNMFGIIVILGFLSS